MGCHKKKITGGKTRMLSGVSRLSYQRDICYAAAQGTEEKKNIFFLLDVLDV
jgi:hypothetical protein